MADRLIVALSLALLTITMPETAAYFQVKRRSACLDGNFPTLSRIRLSSGVRPFNGIASEKIKRSKSNDQTSWKLG
jgi:hypothetical protein